MPLQPFVRSAGDDCRPPVRHPPIRPGVLPGGNLPEHADAANDTRHIEQQRHGVELHLAHGSDEKDSCPRLHIENKVWPFSLR